MVGQPATVSRKEGLLEASFVPILEAVVTPMSTRPGIRCAELKVALSDRLRS